LEIDSLLLKAGHTVNGGYLMMVGNTTVVGRICFVHLYRYSQPNHTHGTNDIVTTAEDAWSLIRVASRAARDDKGSNRRKQVAQNQDVDARSWSALRDYLSTSRPASNCEFLADLRLSSD
jgi:hypothetical protein